ncbi:MAG: hypothetical protein N4A65_11185 [Cohaesibacter sp.]|jgi:sirohydrochlorin ferrochelatase|nr:hypothetical protein [Cohaesibacter sp.]
MTHTRPLKPHKAPEKGEKDRSVLIVAHGERGGRLDNAHLIALTQEAQSLLPQIQIECAVLKGDPSIADAWQTLTGKERYIYPFFMSDGFFVSTILPKKIKAAIGEPFPDLHYLPPFGVSPDLPQVILSRLCDFLDQEGRLDERPPLLIAAHGASIDRQSCLRANELAKEIETSNHFSPVTTAFLDEAPFLEDVIPTLDPRTIVMPHFNGLGSHAIDDMAALKSKAPSGICFTEPVGAFPSVANLIAHDIATALDLGDRQQEAAE